MKATMKEHMVISLFIAIPRNASFMSASVGMQPAEYSPPLPL
jgi:hypothetical protein